MFTQLAPGGVSIGFANAAPRYWTVATPLMWGLRTGARVLDGRDDVRLWPTIACAEQIPQWEGIRLVANRIRELRGALADDAGSQDALATRRVRYACTKLALACSEAQLIDARRYQASYRARQQEHQYIADRFSPAQNQLLAAAYCAKLNGAQDEAADTLTTAIANTLDLAIATLNSLGLHSPADLAARTRAVSPAAPGYATDLCFFAMQCLQGHQVPPRRAIAPVYAQAIRLAREIAGNPAALQPGSHLADSCKRLYQAYKQAPQVVSIIRAGATV